MLLEYYLWIKALHIISVISWMAAMFYLPRLYVYHTQVAVGSEQSELFKKMEHRLLRYICNPAMIASFVFGVLMFIAIPDLLSEGWMHVKLTCLIILFGFHGMCSRWRKAFAADKNEKSEKFFRVANEVPTVLMMIIVLMAVAKPF